MAANVDAMVREGIAAFKAGKKDEALAMLNKAVEIDPYNEEGWLWLSGLVESEEDQRVCLENVLSINPTNERAQQGLEYLNKTTGGTMSPAPAAPATSATVSSVDWASNDIETSSPSNWRNVKEPSSEEYDDWLTGLNIQKDAPAPVASAAAPAAQSPFLGFDDLDTDGDGPFSSAAFGGDSGAVLTSPYAEPADTSGSQFAFKQAPSYSEPPSVPKEPKKSKDDKKKKKDEPPTDDLAAQLEREREQAKVQAAKEAAMKPPPVEWEGTLFPDIPRTVAITRLPGTKERTPILFVLAAIILVLLNIGAATVLIATLL
jgi:tetratricopeptide (TPR) repeat protein